MRSEEERRYVKFMYSAACLALLLSALTFSALANSSIQLYIYRSELVTKQE